MHLLNQELIITLSAFVTYVIGVITFSPLLNKLKKRGYVGKDMYKVGHPPVPEMGGLGIAFAFLAGIIFLESVTSIPFIIYPSLFVLLFYFLFGLLDDILGIGTKEDLSHDKIIKIFIPLFFAFPLFRYVSTSLFIPGIGNIELGLIYLITVLPLFIMITANLVNMFSYYNGQSAGSVLIILVITTIKLFDIGETDLFYLILPFLGSTLAFLSYNLNPAGVFPGDCGDLLMGAVIGTTAVLSGLEFFMFIALLPLIINFLMVTYWFLSKKGDTDIKFGDVRKDGTIIAPNPYTIMWLFPYYFKLTERQTTFLMYVLVICSSITAYIFL